MKLATIAIAYFGATWALPAQVEAQAETKANGLGYIACSNALIFSAPYCCDNRGPLGTVSDCTPPLLPISDDAFEGQCGLFQKSAVCCVPLLNLLPPVLCIPLPRLLVSTQLNGAGLNITEGHE
ncbi:hypothetical protein F5B22DRAFT_180398 [Xylaria bambusicola]|uniref:uncharacterized protein n=1 Tax=Xylaria bambusicola TaxID=326684 RepID=UPI002007FF6A|nr:uncharacterized protein F5B22DRAFT_180398 [Xylaria bambusicola]KAI0516768.1 hypothetical protein F5B22DRAFT_180398 [Xylaria bambusicola]